MVVKEGMQEEHEVVVEGGEQLVTIVGEQLVTIVEEKEQFVLRVQGFLDATL